MQRVEHPHRDRRGGDRCQKRQHHPRQADRELELAGHSCIIACEQRDERPREDYAADDERQRDDQHRVEHVVAKAPGGRFTVNGQLTREDWHERGAHRAFRKQIADEIGNPERDEERVHLVAGAKDRRQHLFAHKPKNAARERGHTGDAGGSRQAEIRCGGCVEWRFWIGQRNARVQEPASF